MGDSEEKTGTSVINRLVRAVNEHNLDDLVGCFDPGYVNETPAHPLRGFTGSDRVRRNWIQILGSVPDLRAQVIDTAESADRVWSEWTMSGVRNDGGSFRMTGVVIFVVRDGVIKSARFYLEPVETDSGGIDAAVARLTSESVQ